MKSSGFLNPFSFRVAAIGAVLTGESGGVGELDGCGVGTRDCGVGVRGMDAAKCS